MQRVSTTSVAMRQLNFFTILPSYVHPFPFWQCLLTFLPKSVLSLVALIYFIFASGPSRGTRLLPWFIWGQLALDAIMFIFWLSAGATSSYSCDDLCTVCGVLDGFVYFDSQTCECYSDLFYKRDFSPRPMNLLQSRGDLSKRRRSNSTVGGSIAAKQAFDAVMTSVHTSRFLEPAI